MTPRVGRARAIARQEIIEEIVFNLMPLKVTEKEALRQISFHLGWLDHLHSLDRQSHRLRKSDARKTYKNIRQSALSLISAFEVLPPTGALLLFMGFAGDRQPSWKSKESFSRAKEQLPAFRLELKGLAETAERELAVGDFKQGSGKEAFAYRAYFLMANTSKGRITGTVDSPYRTIADLFYKAVTGEKIDMKHWCDDAIKALRKSKGTVS